MSPASKICYVYTCTSHVPLVYLANYYYHFRVLLYIILIVQKGRSWYNLLLIIAIHVRNIIHLYVSGYLPVSRAIDFET